MMIDGNGDWFPLPDEPGHEFLGVEAVPRRLDSLMPSDAETGAVCYDAFQVYLGASIDLMARQGQPFTLLAIGADPSETMQFLGAHGARLIGSAMARWLRQETRVHDVIGRAMTNGAYGAPAFLMACPLMTEALAALFAERLREAMTISAADQGSPWLTVSVGVGSLSLDSQSPDTLISRAEEALASAQRAGGGRVWSHFDTVRRIMNRDWPDSVQE